MGILRRKNTLITYSFWTTSVGKHEKIRFWWVGKKIKPICNVSFLICLFCYLYSMWLWESFHRNHVYFFTLRSSGKHLLPCLVEWRANQTMLLLFHALNIKNPTSLYKRAWRTSILSLSLISFELQKWRWNVNLSQTQQKYLLGRICGYQFLNLNSWFFKRF